MYIQEILIIIIAIFGRRGVMPTTEYEHCLLENR